MAEITVQVVTNDVVANVVLVADTVTISADGKTLVGFPGGDYTIPADDPSFFMMQPDAGIGWTYDGDVLVAPPLKPLPEGAVIGSTEFFAGVDFDALLKRKA